MLQVFGEIKGVEQLMERMSGKKHLEYSYDGFSDLFEHFLVMMQQLVGKKHPT